MLLFSPAKINIGLSVIGKRPDGFHDISTLFYPIPWEDAIEVFVSKEFSIHTYGLDLEIPIEEHLIYKTWRLLQSEYSALQNFEVEVHHLKHVPFGAGLGGGSANVASFIKMINQIFKCQWSIEIMKQMASQIGSDCSFFIENKPSIGKGRGDQLEKVHLSLTDYTLQIIAPNIHISTAEAFKQLSIPFSKNIPIDYNLVLKSPVEEWKNLVWNDFLPGLTPIYPEIKEGIHLLYEEGAIFSDLSGSGSSYYGIFQKGHSSKNSFFKEFPQIII